MPQAQSTGWEDLWRIGEAFMNNYYRGLGFAEEKKEAEFQRGLATEKEERAGREFETAEARAGREFEAGQEYRTGMLA